MALHLHSAIKTDCRFLAHPPPQKKRPIRPLPPLPSSPSLEATQATHGLCRRSSAFTAIASWAAHVQPGSPASLSPCSPHRRPSLLVSARAPSASFLHITPTPNTAFAPTPSVRDFKADLTTVGYTSVFLQLPNTPVSATLSIRPPVPPVPPSTCKPRGLAHFRSLSALRSRGKPKSSCPTSPTRMKAKAAATSAAIVKRKKAKYAMRPPPLTNELALMQFADGGDIDCNIKRILEAQAKATGTIGHADVYRNGAGGVWWDQDEEWEYAHLLAEGNGSRPQGDIQWVTFGGNMSPTTAGVLGEDRRGSMSTQDSDLDPKFVVQPVDSLDGDDLALFKPNAPLLSLPSRPRRAARHLRKPTLLVDVAFSRPYSSPKSPKFQTLSAGGAGMKPKGKFRRRPAPLKLSPPSPAFKRPTNSPIDADKVRRDFLAASFEPLNLIPVTPVTPAMAMVITTPTDVRGRLVGNSRAINVPWPSLAMTKKPSMLNMMGFFRSAKKGDVKC